MNQPVRHLKLPMALLFLAFFPAVPASTPVAVAAELGRALKGPVSMATNGVGGSKKKCQD